MEKVVLLFFAAAVGVVLTYLAVFWATYWLAGTPDQRREYREREIEEEDRAGW